MDCGPRSCINFADFVWEKIKTFTFLSYAIICVPLDTTTILYLHLCRSTSDGGRITSAPTVSEIVHPRPESSSPSVPSQILANVMYIYANHRPSVIWLGIRSSITLSIYESSNLQVVRCFTSMFTRQTTLLFPSVSWFRIRTSLYDVLSPDTLWASSKRGFTTIACPRQMCSGAHSTTNTASYEEVVARLRSERRRWR